MIYRPIGVVDAYPANALADGTDQHRLGHRTSILCQRSTSRDKLLARLRESRLPVAFYFQLFWAPAIASALLLGLLWMQDELVGRLRWFAAGWFLLAFAAQYFRPMPAAFIIGLILQTALAVFLLLKIQLDRW